MNINDFARLLEHSTTETFWENLGVTQEEFDQHIASGGHIPAEIREEAARRQQEHFGAHQPPQSWPPRLTAA